MRGNISPLQIFAEEATDDNNNQRVATNKKHVHLVSVQGMIFFSLQSDIILPGNIKQILVGLTLAAMSSSQINTGR